MQIRCPNDVSAARKAPSHERLGDFIRNRLAGNVMENLFYQLVEKLLEQGHISFANLFVDGTKIEANANRYGFVWRNSVLKNEAKMHAQIEMKLLELQAKYNCFETPPTLGGYIETPPKEMERQRFRACNGERAPKERIAKRFGNA